MSNTTTELLKVQGTEVHVEGNGPRTVVMLHGWPDTYRLWDSTVEALAPHYRCVRLTLPGFAGPNTGNTLSLDDIISTLHAVVQTVSPNEPVTLLLHDWGCVFGYELALRHPQNVDKVIAVDIGDYNAPAYLRSLSLVQKLMVVFYQVWLAKAWLLGRYVNRALGNGLTRWMAHATRCPNPSANIHWYMNYPYAMAWFGVGGGLRKARPVKRAWPMLYFHGKRKPFAFQSPQWLAEVEQAPGCEVHAMDSGHWVMVDQPDAFTTKVLAWLAH